MCEHDWTVIEFDGGYLSQCEKCGVPQLSPYRLTSNQMQVVRTCETLDALKLQKCFYEWDYGIYKEAVRYWHEINE